MSEIRGNVIPVFCFFSLFWMLLIGWGVSDKLLDGPKTQDEIEFEMVQILEAYTPGDYSMTNEAIKEAALDVKILNENFTVYLGGKAILLIIGAISILLMFTLRKSGYWLYLIYTIAWPTLVFIYFGGTTSGNIAGVATTAVGLTFAIIYGSQLKRMDRSKLIEE